MREVACTAAAATTSFRTCAAAGSRRSQTAAGPGRECETTTACRPARAPAWWWWSCSACLRSLPRWWRPALRTGCGGAGCGGGQLQAGPPGGDAAAPSPCSGTLRMRLGCTERMRSAGSPWLTSVPGWRRWFARAYPQTAPPASLLMRRARALDAPATTLAGGELEVQAPPWTPSPAPSALRSPWSTMAGRMGEGLCRGAGLSADMVSVPPAWIR